MMITRMSATTATTMPIARAVLVPVELSPPKPWADDDVGVDPGEDEGATGTGGVKLPEEGLPP